MSDTRMLPVPLTEDELRERGAELAAKFENLTSLEQIKKDTAKRQKDEIDEARDGVLALSRIVSSKKEWRLVEVIERFDLERRVVIELRTDTGEVVSSRPMSAAEIQEHEQARLPFGKGEPAKTAAATGT